MLIWGFSYLVGPSQFDPEVEELPQSEAFRSFNGRSRAAHRLQFFPV